MQLHLFLLDMTQDLKNVATIILFYLIQDKKGIPYTFFLPFSFLSEKKNNCFVSALFYVDMTVLSVDSLIAISWNKYHSLAFGLNVYLCHKQLLTYAYQALLRRHLTVYSMLKIRQTSKNCFPLFQETFPFYGTNH